jgi:uncharacterized membrane protein
MKPTLSFVIFVLTELLVTGFILATTSQLPDSIASHFNGAGAPNGFMTHQGYTVFMLVFVIGIPLVSVVSIPLTFTRSPDKINLPNKEYWLAPERREQTMRFLKSHLVWLGTGIAAFIGYMHWLLLQANAVSPPRLPADQFVFGVVAFVAAVFIWAFWMIARFLLVPRK